MVAHPALISGPERLIDVAREVAGKIARAREVGADAVIVTPVCLPSGRHVSVRLTGGPVEFVVTDDGAAMREAELMGAEDICRREARKVAAELSLKFNEWELFEAHAPLDRLPGFVAIVANAASVTMIRTADKFAERFDLRRREALATRLERVFGRDNVAKNVDVAGASSKRWKFDARVSLPSGRPGLFSIVTPAPSSVAFAYSKIDDVSRMDPTPFVGAVLDGSFDADDKALLARAARRLFDVNDPDEAFRNAA